MKFSKPKASYQLNNQPEQKKNHIKLKNSQSIKKIKTVYATITEQKSIMIKSKSEIKNKKSMK
jgi:hypothetical protein